MLVNHVSTSFSFDAKLVEQCTSVSLLLVEAMMLEEVGLKLLALIEGLSISCTLLYLCTSVHHGGLSEMQ
jgi:response regulator RpfG family c-di-GMP phosphodiesterase